MIYDTNIDKNNLDEEAIYTPGAFDVFSIKESEASEQWDALKDKMKVLQADVALEIRGWSIDQINSFFQLEIMKVTEEVYKQLVFIHPAVIQLYNEIGEARYNTKMYATARKSLEEKAAGLDRLVKLHGQGYFMKVEGRPYKKMEVESILSRVKKTIIQRLKAEKAQKPQINKTSPKKTPKVPKPPVKEIERLT
jgi:hypothetical protein